MLCYVLQPENLYLFAFVRVDQSFFILSLFNFPFCVFLQVMVSNLIEVLESREIQPDVNFLVHCKFIFNGCFVDYFL